MSRILAFLASLSLLAAAALAQVGTSPAIPVSVTFPGAVHDIEFDAARNRFYVSVPDQNRVYVVSKATFAIETSVIVSPRPTGIDVSHDGSLLFVALNQGGAVAYVDLQTLQVTTTVQVGALLEHPTTWDVLEAKPDWLFVSANPSSSGFAKIVLIRRDLGNSASAVASNRIIRAGPVFHEDPLQQHVYVGEGFSPNSLYKLSLASPTAPIVLEDNHGSVEGTQHADVSPDGARILLRSGQILDAGNFQQVGVLGAGPGRYGIGGARAFTMTSNTLLTVFNTATQLPVATQSMGCPTSSFNTVTRLWLADDDATALAVVADRVCGVTTSPTPVVQSVTPGRSRHDAGVVPVTITGNYFDLGGQPSVTVGGEPATNVVATGPTTILCTFPPAGPGPKDVAVTNGNGTGVLLRGFVRTPAMSGPALASPGQSIPLDVAVTPLDVLVMFYSVGQPISVPLPGAVGTLAMAEPVHLLTAPGWPLANMSLSLPLPALPGLVGLTIVLQTLAHTPQAGTWAITNAATFTIQ